MEKFLEIMKHHLTSIIEIASILIICVILFKLIDAIASQILKNAQKTNYSKKIAKFSIFFVKLSKFLVLFFMLTVILQKHGYSLTSLIAGFGITGLAVGFAAKESIANIFGSLAIIYDNIYDVGDYIKIGEIEGTVEDLNLRSTKIRTLDNVLATIPNCNVANSLVENFSRIKNRRISEIFGLTYDTSAEKLTLAKKLIEETLSEFENISDNFNIYLDKFDSSSINISMYAYVNFSDIDNFRQIKDNFLTRILDKFRQNDISLAYPTQTIFVEK